VALTEPESTAPTGEARLPYTGEDFDAFYRREFNATVVLAYALSGRWAVAEELAQEAFLVAHRQWDRVSRYEQPRAFVRRVVVNAAVSHRRRAAAEARALVRLVAGQRPAPAVLGPDAAAFWRLVRALPRRQAQVTALFYLEDRSIEDIATVLGCAEATVKVHLHRARAALARRLDVPGGEDE
jgi:RNA polymerase sigma-70 factor (ECF subfamily)